MTRVTRPTNPCVESAWQTNWRPADVRNAEAAFIELRYAATPERKPYLNSETFDLNSKGLKRFSIIKQDSAHKSIATRLGKLDIFIFLHNDARLRRKIINYSNNFAKK